MSFVFYFITLVFISLVYYWLAKKYNIVDVPNERSSHHAITVRGGGILFYFAILCFFIASEFQYPYLFFGVSLIAVVSFIDDIKSLSVSQRLPFQFLGLLLILYSIIAFDNMFLFTVVLMVLIVMLNAFNFMDGINGMIGLYGIVTIGTFCYLNFYENILNQELLVSLLISLVVFGFYNFRKKALFFAGDVGSMTLGAGILFCTYYFISSLNSPLFVLLIAVYTTESIGTLIKRMVAGKNIFKPHREHIYEMFANNKGYAHLIISVGYAMLQLALNLIVIFNYKTMLYSTQLLVVALVMLTLGGFYLVGTKISKYN